MSSGETRRLAGKCECGTVRYTVPDAFRYALNLVFGEEHLNNTRCAVCGSLLFSVVRDGANVHVALGTLVDAPSLQPTKHIFVGSKAPWFEITDDLPQFDEYPT